MKLARSRRRFLLALGAVGATPLGLGLAGANDPHEGHVTAAEADSDVIGDVEDTPVTPEEVTPEDSIPDTAEALDKIEDVDRRIIRAYYSKPQTGGGSSYLRYTPIHVLEPGDVLELSLRSKLQFATPPAARLVIHAAPPSGSPLSHKGPVVASATVQARLKSETKSIGGGVKSRQWVYDWRVPSGLADGNYVLHSSIAGTLPASVIIATGAAPALAASRKLAVCSTNMKGDRPVTGDTWFWVDYPVKRKSLPIQPRAALRFTEPMSYDNLWVEDITATTGTFLREPIETEEGWVVTNPQQRYNQANAFRELGDLRAGKRFDGRPGNVVSGTAFDDGLYALTPIGAFFIDLEGTITPLFGRFMKPGGLYPHTGATRVRNHHLVGQWACPAGLNGAMAICVTKDRRTAYVADSDNNRILAVDLTQNPCVVRHVAGRYVDPSQPMCAHSAYRGDMKGGQVDGPGDEADFGHPLGLLLSDDEKSLYIGDDHNCAIRKIDLATRKVSTAIQSRMVHPHTALPLGKSNVNRYRATMAGDGSAESATFMHVGQMAWDSKGRIIAAIHHTFEIRRFDLAKKTSERIVLSLIGSRADMQPKAWVSLDVDRTGELGVVDRIVVANWFADTDDYYLPNPDGSYSAKKDILASSPPGYPRVAAGPGRHVRARGYPWFVKIGPGSLWIADSSNGGLVRITQRRETDPAVPAIGPTSQWTSRTERHERGAELWFSEQPSGNPPRFLMHGSSGCNQIGFELTARLGSMSDAELASVLGRGQYNDRDWEALLAYVRMITMNSRT